MEVGRLKRGALQANRPPRGSCRRNRGFADD